MEKGICLLRIIPIRREPSDRSEMVSQLLFGEVYRISGQEKAWLMITTEFDRYTGWIDRKMHHTVSEDYYRKLAKGGYVVAARTTEILLTPEKESYLIPAGSTLGFLATDGTLEIDSLRYKPDAGITSQDPDHRENIINTAKQFIYAPYLWGGRSPFGYDCSGFIQVVFKIHGMRLPRDAWQQATAGQSIDSVRKAVPGDLVFFAGEENRIFHVGLVFQPGRIIHCSGMVRIDTLDEEGIFNRQINGYTHRLHSIRRLTEGIT